MPWIRPPSLWKLGAINTVCLESSLISGSFMLMIWSVLCTFHTRTRSKLYLRSGLGLINTGGPVGSPEVRRARVAVPARSHRQAHGLNSGAGVQRLPSGAREPPWRLWREG